MSWRATLLWVLVPDALALIGWSIYQAASGTNLTYDQAFGATTTIVGISVLLWGAVGMAAGVGIEQENKKWSGEDTIMYQYWGLVLIIGAGILSGATWAVVLFGPLLWLPSIIALVALVNVGIPTASYITGRDKRRLARQERLATMERDVLGDGHD